MNYLIGVPGGTSLSTHKRIGSPFKSAASSIPLLSMPPRVAGARLLTTTIFYPPSCTTL
ncbi:MAG: hypothetical protein Q8N60_01570 [Candidatus Diapherotrites archaeon]|nr:hypothetical protein [Candidatus Diapherotrites archaeon]